MKKTTKFVAMSAAAFGIVAALSAGPASAGVPPIADLSVKEPGGVGFAGDGVYGGGLGQEGFAELCEDETGTFKIRIQQDTTHVVPVTVDGDGSSTHFRVRYFKGDENISKAVKQGTYATPPLTVGQQKTIKMEVTAKDAVNTGLGFFVTGDTATGVPDTVLVEVANPGPCLVAM